MNLNENIKLNEDINSINKLEERFINKYVYKSFLERIIEPYKLDYKIAIQLSGGLRCFKYTIPWINHFIIKPLNADVFINGWANNMGVVQNEIEVQEYDNLKDFKINDKDDPKFDFLKINNRGDQTTNKNIEKLYGQYFNLLECNKLRNNYEKLNNFNYDLVIRCRPDVFFFQEFDIKDIISTINNNYLSIPINYFHRHYCNLTPEIFAMGSNNIMNEYCNAFYSIEDSIKNFGIGGESVIHYHINNIIKNVHIHNIDINFVIDYPVEYNFDELYLVNTRHNGEAKTQGGCWSY